jgi:hypothetical protein
MKGKKFTLVALLFVTLIVVGVLVWPKPKPALAATWSVRLELDWNGRGVPRNVHAQAVLVDGGGDDFGGWINLAPSNNWSVWTNNLNDPNANADSVRFRWDFDAAGADLGYIWNPAPTPHPTVVLNSEVTVLHSDYLVAP